MEHLGVLQAFDQEKARKAAALERARRRAALHCEE